MFGRTYIALFACVSLVNLAAASSPPIVICSHPLANDIEWASHFVARFAVEEYYAPLFPNATWSYKFLGDGDASPRNLVKSWSLLGRLQCNALLGPGISSLAESLSPVVDKLWLDWSSTSIALSDRTNYPLFSRVIPTDALGADMLALAMLSKFNWTTANLLYLDSSYGRSFASGFSDAFSSRGGTVILSRSVAEVNPSRDGVLNAFQSFLTVTKSQVVVIAMSPTDAAFSTVSEVVKTEGYGQKFIFLFSEVACSGSDASLALVAPLMEPLGGGICAAYSANDFQMSLFAAAFAGRNQSIDEAKLSQSEISSSHLPLPQAAGGAYDAFVLDAVNMLMRTLYEQPRGSSVKTLRNAMLLSTLNGASGFVSFDSNGDRPYADGILYNFVINSTTSSQVAIADIVNRQVNATQTQTRLYLMGKLFGAGEVPASERFTADRATNQLPISANTLLAILISGLTFLVLGFFTYKAYQSKKIVKLIKMGLWVIVLQCMLLCAFVVLQIVTIITVSLKNYPTIFVALYCAISGLSITVYIVEVSVLAMYFLRNVKSDNNLSEEEIVRWEFRVAQVHIVGLGVRDLPGVAMNFAAILQDRSTVIMVSMCVSCIFAGMKYMEVRARLWKFFSLDFTPPRQFQTLKQAVHRIMILKRLGIEIFSSKGTVRQRRCSVATTSGDGGQRSSITLTADGGEHSHPPQHQSALQERVSRRMSKLAERDQELTSASTAKERLQFHGRWRFLQRRERVAEVEKVAKKISIMLRNDCITSDEFFAVISQYFDHRFDPVDEDKVVAQETRRFSRASAALPNETEVPSASDSE